MWRGRGTKTSRLFLFNLAGQPPVLVVRVIQLKHLMPVPAPHLDGAHHKLLHRLLPGRQRRHLVLNERDDFRPVRLRQRRSLLYVRNQRRFCGGVIGGRLRRSSSCRCRCGRCSAGGCRCGSGCCCWSWCCYRRSSDPKSSRHSSNSSCSRMRRRSSICSDTFGWAAVWCSCPRPLQRRCC